MLPVKLLRTSLGTLLAGDVPTLAPVAANKIALIAAPFTPGENLTLAGLTLATFTGSAPKAGAAGPQGTGIDPVTGEQKINILPPAGGYIFTCTVAPGAPETIYGFALTDNAGAVLLAVQAFSTPIVIAAVGDQVDCENPEINFVLAPMF